MLYLVAVLVSATAFGRGPAIVASVAAFVAFDWWFIEPLHQLSVADPEQYVSLLLFLLVAIVTSQLAAEQRSRTAQALDREREAVILADVAGLTAAPDLGASLVAAAARIQQELDVAAVRHPPARAATGHRAAVGRRRAALPWRPVRTGERAQPRHGRERDGARQDRPVGPCGRAAPA